MLLNYADRGSLSIVAPVLKGRLAIDNAAMGMLLSAFFWTYALSQSLAGWIAQRYPPAYVLAGGVALWSLATMACGFATSFATLFAFRLLLGVGESVIFPANARIFATFAADHQRGRANSVMTMGMALGPTIGTLAGGLILVQFGWRAVFIALGGISLLWLLPWIRYSGEMLGTRRTPIAVAPARYADILRQKSLWGAALGQYCYSYPTYLMLTWLPLYLVKAQHFTLLAMTQIGAAVYVAQALAGLLSGTLSDRLIQSGLSPTHVRKGFLLAGLIGSGVALVSIGLVSAGVAIVCLVATGFCTGLASPMVFTIGQTIAGPRACGRWMGIQNMVGNFSGISAPIITGLMVDWTGSFAGAFAIPGALAIVGTICWAFVVGSVAPIAWPVASSESLASPSKIVSI